MSILEKAYNRLFPEAEDLWAAGGADLVKLTVNNEKHELPVYGLEITSCDEVGDKLVHIGEGKQKRVIGHEVLYCVGVNDAPHLARVMLPNDGDRHDPSNDFTFNRSTAYTTTIHGYAKTGSRMIVAETGRPFIDTGAIYSGNEGFNWASLLRAPITAWDSRNQSLHAQSEARYVMHRHLTALHELPEDFAIVGDSMSTMNQPGMFAYEHIYGEGDLDDPITAEASRIIGFHAKGRCVLHRVEMRDLPKVGVWVVQTMLGGTAAAACVAKNGDIRPLVSSISTNPEFNASAFFGTLRALATGEGGMQLRYVPRGTGGLEVQYGNDGLSDVEFMKEFYKSHPDVRHKIVPNGTHGAILHPLADEGRTAWAVRLSEDYDRVGGRKSELNWPYIGNVREIDPLAVEPAA